MNRQFKKISDKYRDLLKENYDYDKTSEFKIDQIGAEKKFPLYMKDFDYELVKKFTLEKIKPNIRKGTNRKYGDDKRDDYLYNITLLDITAKICRENSWLTRKDWIEHKVPTNEIIKKVVASAEEYSQVNIYFESNKKDENKKKNIIKKNIKR